MFIKYTNLEESPQYTEKTKQLIEQAFEYKNHSFSIDFYPLMKKENRLHCHILVKQDEVVAHIGVLNRVLLINDKSYTVSMYGGIAVHPAEQGKGLFKKLYSKLKERYTQSVLHLLWSEKLDLYKKFGFHPCGLLREYKKHSFQHSFNISKTKLKLINANEMNSIQSLYQNQNEIRFSRSKEHWNELKKIESSDLFIIKQDQTIKNYFFMNKGQDLTGIIHEYGLMNETQKNIMLNYGNLWSPFESNQRGIDLFAMNLKIGHEKEFKEFISSYLKISILKITDVVEFSFNKQSYTLPIFDFLQGTLGPNRFKEINAPYLFFSGLDSI